MTSPTFYAGFDGYLELDDSSGTPRNFTPYVEKVDDGVDQDVHTAAPMGAKGKRKVAGQDDATITIEGLWNPQIDTWVGAQSTWRTARTYKLGPIGNTTSNPYRSCEAIIKSYKCPVDSGGMNKFTLVLEKDGDFSTGVY